MTDACEGKRNILLHLRFAKKKVVVDDELSGTLTDMKMKIVQHSVDHL